MSLPGAANAELLSLAFATSSGAITISRLRDGLYLEANQGFAEMWGWAVGEVLGHTTFEHDIWYDAAERDRFVQALQREGRVRNMLCRFRRRSGEVFHGHMSGSLFEANGEPHIFAVTQDVEDIIQARQRAEASETRLRTLLAHIPHGIREIDMRGVILLENPAHADLFGYEPGELVGRRALDLLADPDKAAELQQVIDSYDPAAGPRAGGYEADMTRKDGSVIRVRVDWSIQPPVGPGAPPTVISVLTDLTPTVRAQEELRHSVDELTRSNAELERYAYIAAHDLREPIRTVTSYAQLLRRRLTTAGQLTGDMAELFDYLETGAHRMSAVVDDLLAYSRLQSRAAPFEPVDLDGVMTTVRNNLARVIHECGAEVVCETPLPTVTADAAQMVQLFQNLVANALRYQPEADSHTPRVVLAARRETAGWAIAVADNGIGIEARFFDRIFQLFQRLHSQREYPGTGVGLAICQRVAERHGGAIDVESEVGVGTTFTVHLPDVPPEDAAVAQG
ncbi:PAS domain S-box protein [Caenispirillum salinarum]|uniref:sensor histidine kinase n=1 Tax=Caenispirillum salinarum TaxID=859058 RepID=UPI003850F7A4